MIIDGHAHACGPFLKAETLVPFLDDAGVDKVVLTAGELDSVKSYNLADIANWFPQKDVVFWINRLARFSVSLTGSAGHLDERNAHVAALVRACPDRVLQFYWTDPTRPDIIHELEKRHSQWNFAGLKLQQGWERFKIPSPGLQEIARWAGEKNLPIFIHAYSKKDILALVEFVQIHRNTRFILGHLLGMEYFPRKQEGGENLYFEISLPALISEFRLQKALERHGADRLILGSDTPYGKESLKRNIQRVRELPISKIDQGRILGENLGAILGLNSSL